MIYIPKYILLVKKKKKKKVRQKITKHFYNIHKTEFEFKIIYILLSLIS